MSKSPGIAFTLIYLTGLAITSGQTAGHSEARPDYARLYAQHRWFELRSAVSHGNAPAFYRAVTAATFGDPQAEKALQAVIAAAPKTKQASASREFLINLSLLHGRYHTAWEQVEAALAVNPHYPGMKAARAMFSPLSKFPDMAVAERGTATLQYSMYDGNLFIPVLIEGKPARYLVDTGASFSAISQAEAKRLGLTILDGAAQGQDSTGGKVALRMAMASRLSIGPVQLANVPFLVLPDNQPPFDGAPEDQKGVLGLPVLLALGTMRWDASGGFTAGFPGEQWKLALANLCFEETGAATQAALEGKELRLIIDTGASESKLWPPFASQFSNATKSGKKQSTQLTGVGHSLAVDSIILPELTIQLAGTDATLRPAKVLRKTTTEASRWYHGVLGIDVLVLQKRVVTFDFNAMRLTVQ